MDDNHHDINSTAYGSLTAEEKNSVLTLLFRREDLIRDMYFKSVERSIKTLFFVDDKTLRFKQSMQKQIAIGKILHRQLPEPCSE